MVASTRKEDKSSKLHKPGSFCCFRSNMQKDGQEQVANGPGCVNPTLSMDDETQKDDTVTETTE